MEIGKSSVDSTLLELNVFHDFKGRQAGIIKALTTDFEEFFRRCDPEKENLCLFGLPNEQWEVNLPVDDVPAQFPEPALGINFARDALGKDDWLSYIAAHSDAWLVAMAFYDASRLGFSKAERADLFTMINELPTVFEAVAGANKETPATNRNSRKSMPKSGAVNQKRQRREKSQAKCSIASQHIDANECLSEGTQETQEESLCGACNKNSPSDEFWICCDACDTWFHGKCVGVTPQMAEHIDVYACLRCIAKRRLRLELRRK